jgi:hypothetical protein
MRQSFVKHYSVISQSSIFRVSVTYTPSKSSVHVFIVGRALKEFCREAGTDHWKSWYGQLGRRLLAPAGKMYQSRCISRAL